MASCSAAADVCSTLQGFGSVQHTLLAVEACTHTLLLLWFLIVHRPESFPVFPLLKKELPLKSRCFQRRIFGSHSLKLCPPHQKQPCSQHFLSLSVYTLGPFHQTVTSALKISVELESRIKANSSWGFSPQSEVTIYR